MEWCLQTTPQLAVLWVTSELLMRNRVASDTFQRGTVCNNVGTSDVSEAKTILWWHSSLGCVGLHWNFRRCRKVHKLCPQVLMLCLSVSQLILVYFEHFIFPRSTRFVSLFIVWCFLNLMSKYKMNLNCHCVELRFSTIIEGSHLTFNLWMGTNTCISSLRIWLVPKLLFCH